jgi:ornithine--oxo-acid transaminase
MKESTMTSTTESLIAIETQYSAHNYKPLDVVITRGEGIWLYDVDGKRYLDFLSSYSAVNQGHCHSRIINALVDQASKLTLTSRAFRNDQFAPFAKELCDLSGFEMMLPMNSGAEAVETAVKAVRKWGYQVKGVAENKAEIIVCEGNFHGRTLTVISFSTEEQYKADFGPFTPGFKVVPFGDIEALKQAITPNTVGFLFEPIQGERGIMVPPAGYLQQVRQICSANQVLMMADEIQTGLGRTGRLFACDWEKVKPDVAIIGKALGGGVYPISAVLTSKEVLGLFKPGDHGSTFGGNPLACAVGREALRVIVEEELCERSAKLCEYFQNRLRAIYSPYIKEVRGKGLLIGLELTDDAGGARKYCEALMEKGLLCKETHDNVIRFAPPLVIDQANLDWAIGQVESVLRA